VPARRKGQRYRSPVRLDQFFVDLGLQVLRQPRPALIRPGHREKDLARVEAAPVVVGIEQPDGDLRLAARLDAAGLGVVVVEAVHRDAVFAFVLAIGDALDLHVRLADEPERFVAGALLLEVVGQEVGVHLRLEQRHARPVGLVNVLGCLRVELEGGEKDDLRLRHQRLRLLDGLGHLALLQRGVLGAEGDDDALHLRGRAALPHLVRARIVGTGLPVGVQPAAAGQRLQPGEADVLARLAANAGAQQLVAPLALAQRLAGAGDGGIGRLRRALEQFLKRLYCRGGHRLDGERTADAGFLLVHEGLIVERLLRRVAGDGGVDLLARHALLDVRVIGDGLERHMRHGFVFEAASDAFLRVRQLVVVKRGGHQPLFGQRQRHPRGVAGDPAAPPLLGHVSGGAAAAGGVKDQVARVGGHQQTARRNLHVGLNNIDLRFTESGCRIRPAVLQLYQGEVGVKLSEIWVLTQDE